MKAPHIDIYIYTQKKIIIEFCKNLVKLQRLV